MYVNELLFIIPTLNHIPNMPVKRIKLKVILNLPFNIIPNIVEITPNIGKAINHIFSLVKEIIVKSVLIGKAK